MIQLIGLLLSVYMVLKGFELYGYPTKTLPHRIGAGLFWAFGLIFFVAFLLAPLGNEPMAGLEPGSREATRTQPAYEPEPVLSDEEVQAGATTEALPLDAFDNIE